MPARRRVLLGTAVTVAASPGCLGEVDQIINRDRDDHEDVPPDATVVRYADLSERSQAFVDASIGDSLWTCDRGGHVLRWVIRNGARVYVERDADTGQLVQAEEPLTLDSVDSELEQVFHDGTYLEKEGRSYESYTDNSAGPYRSLYVAEDADECEEVVRSSELSGSRRDLADALLNEGEAWVAEERYAPFADADVYSDEMGDLGDFVRVIEAPNGTCLDGNDRSVQLRFADQDEMIARRYCLARRPPDH